MRKGLTVFTAMIVVLSMTACSSLDLLKKSGIMQDSDYQEYQSLYDAGELNEAGEYVFESDHDNNPDGLNTPQGSIHVTFADNRYLKIEYFRNESMTESIDIDSCYLDPGDSIYGSLLGFNNPGSDDYDLAGYRIVQIFEDGSRMTLTESEADANGLVFEIQKDFTGNELSVIPLGHYFNWGGK